jgi:hypothetical protein
MEEELWEAVVSKYKGIPENYCERLRITTINSVRIIGAPGQHLEYK